MKDDTTIIPFHQPDSVSDPLTGIAREGARRMLAEALKAEADAFVASFVDETLPDGRQRVVGHGHGPERSIQTGIGTLDVPRPKVRDRAGGIPAGAEVRFTSNILPQTGAALVQPRCAAAGALPARDLDRRFPGGAWRISRARRRQTCRPGRFPG